MKRAQNGISYKYSAILDRAVHTKNADDQTSGCLAQSLVSVTQHGLKSIDCGWVCTADKLDIYLYMFIIGFQFRPAYSLWGTTPDKAWLEEQDR
jgi:hypothetical protein